MEDLINEIKKKKELSTISSSYVLTEIEKLFLRNPALKKSFEKSPTNKIKKLIIKEVRCALRPIFGVFNFHVNKRPTLDPSIVLKTHSSTKERLPIYAKAYEEIFKRVGKVESILDLGCGLNPFAIDYLPFKPLRYIASDISELDLGFISQFLKSRSIKVQTQVIDLRSIESNPRVVKFKADVCFLFKVLDVIEKKSHKLGEIILKNLETDWMVVSFSKIKIKGTKMNCPKRSGFEKVLAKLNLNFEIIDFDSEDFYIIKNKMRG